MDSADVARALARYGIRPDEDDLAAITAIAGHQRAVIDGLLTIAGTSGVIDLVPDLDDPRRGATDAQR